MKVVTSEQMRHIDEEAAKNGLPTSVLMENAGKAVAEETRRILGGTNHTLLVLVGPGNNGGDGLVAARYLHEWGAKVTVYLCSKRPEGDQKLKLVQERNIPCLEASADAKLEKFNEKLAAADAVIDALFGTGKGRPLHGVYVPVLERVNELRNQKPSLCVIALDLPTGLNADTGAVDTVCLNADYTLTLACPKLGLYNLPGAERVGKITVLDIGIPSHLAGGISTELITGEVVKPLLPARPIGANKGTFGRVLVVAGSINYIGAAYLACCGALRVGAGLVTLATPISLQPVLATKLAEVTYLPLPEYRAGILSPEAYRTVLEQIPQYDVMLVGCGLGQFPSTTAFIKALLLNPKQQLPPLVLDADALNIMSNVPRWWQQMPGDAIFTPHPGEMARLMEKTVEEVQNDRLRIAQIASAQWHKTVVLKGAFTVVTRPDGQTRICPIANPGLASGGTGDVLSGVIAGLAAQGIPLFNAAVSGVYLHSKAGEMVRARMGDAGMLASDLLPELPVAIKNLKER